MNKPHLISETRTEDGNLDRVDSTWSDGSEGVRYEHRELPAINDDGTAFNGDRRPVLVAYGVIAAVTLVALVELVKALF